jgi:hypothetical protein
MLLWLIYVLIAIIIIVVLLKFLLNVLFIGAYGLHDIGSDVNIAANAVLR